MAVSPREPDEDVVPLGTAPGAGPEGAAAGTFKAAVEPQDASEPVGKGDRAADFFSAGARVNAEEALKVERDEVELAATLPVDGGRPNPRGCDQRQALTPQGDRNAEPGIVGRPVVPEEED